MQLHSFHLAGALVLAFLSVACNVHGSETPPPIPAVAWQDLMDLDQGHEAVVLEGIRLQDGREVDFLLQPFNIVSDSGIVVIESRQGSRSVEEGDLVHLYRGHVPGSTDSQIFLAATDRYINGFFRLEE